MFRNYFKIALRNVRKYKVFSIINKNYHRIYRLMRSSRGNTVPDYPGTPSPLAPACKEKFPELEEYVRIDPFMGKTKHLIASGDKMFYEERFILADPSLFDVFDFILLKGDRRTLLDEPNDLVITQSIAEKYFGDEDPLGKTVLYDGKTDFVISGVMEDVPRNSHFRFNFLASYRFINEIKQWRGKLSSGKQGLTFRNILVVFQFIEILSMPLPLPLRRVLKDGINRNILRGDKRTMITCFTVKIFILGPFSITSRLFNNGSLASEFFVSCFAGN